jgi:ribonuclease HI
VIFETIRSVRVTLQCYAMNTQGCLESSYPFPEYIIIQDRSEAIDHGCRVFEEGIIERRLVVWVDGSVEKYPRTKKADRLAVGAIRYLDFSSKTWKELVTFSILKYGTAFSLEAEIMAIHEAFRLACELRDKFDHLLIFSDCQSFLQGLQLQSKYACLSNRKLMPSLLTYANTLYDEGIIAELHWVPARSVKGNTEVDKLAKESRRLKNKEQADGILDQITVDPSTEQLPRQVSLQK